MFADILNRQSMPPNDIHSFAVFLLRHGQSEANVSRIIASSPASARDAYGLTATGRDQIRASVSAARASGQLAGRCHVISSPLLRARESAAIAADLLSSVVCLDDRLVERGFGALELGSDDRYEQVWSEDRADPAHAKWSVESAESVRERVTALVRELYEGAARGTFVLCTHGDVASLLLCASGGTPLTRHRDVGAMDNAEIRAVPWRNIVDLSHLRAP